jgi:DNA repair protein RadC
MTIRDWPKDERPREKLLLRGPASLSDAELLAVFLRTGVRGKTAVDLARELLRHFGGLTPLLDADRRDLSAASGIGIAKYAQVQAALELGRRYLEARLHRADTLSSPEATRSYLMYRLKGLAYEAFLCLFLDNRHRVISCEEMFRGTVDTAQVYPREVVKRALVLNAAAVILAHNHGSRINLLMRQGMVTEHNARYPQKYPHREHATEQGQRDAATVAMRSVPSM